MLASQDSGVRLMDLVCQERGIIEKAGRLLEQTTASPTSSQEVSRAAAHVCVCGGGILPQGDPKELPVQGPW